MFNAISYYLDMVIDHGEVVEAGFEKMKRCAKVVVRYRYWSVGVLAVVAGFLRVSTHARGDQNCLCCFHALLLREQRRHRPKQRRGPL